MKAYIATEDQYSLIEKRKIRRQNDIILITKPKLNKALLKIPTMKD